MDRLWKLDDFGLAPSLLPKVYYRGPTLVVTPTVMYANQHRGVISISSAGKVVVVHKFDAGQRRNMTNHTWSGSVTDSFKDYTGTAHFDECSNHPVSGILIMMRATLFYVQRGSGSIQVLNDTTWSPCTYTCPNVCDATSTKNSSLLFLLDGAGRIHVLIAKKNGRKRYLDFLYEFSTLNVSPRANCNACWPYSDPEQDPRGHSKRMATTSRIFATSRFLAVFFGSIGHIEKNIGPTCVLLPLRQTIDPRPMISLSLSTMSHSYFMSQNFNDLNLSNCSIWKAFEIAEKCGKQQRLNDKQLFQYYSKRKITAGAFLPGLLHNCATWKIILIYNQSKKLFKTDFNADQEHIDNHPYLMDKTPYGLLKYLLRMCLVGFIDYRTFLLNCKLYLFRTPVAMAPSLFCPEEIYGFQVFWSGLAELSTRVSLTPIDITTYICETYAITEPIIYSNTDWVDFNTFYFK